MMVGDFDYEAMRQVDQIWTPFFFFFFIVFVFSEFLFFYFFSILKISSLFFFLLADTTCKFRFQHFLFFSSVPPRLPKNYSDSCQCLLGHFKYLVHFGARSGDSR